MKSVRRNMILASFLLIAVGEPSLALERGLGLVVITNDDGITEKSRLLAIAHAVIHAGGEPVIIASREDRSGSSNFLQLRQSGQLAVAYSVEQDVPIYVTDGYPADAVVLVTAGLLGDRKPDLVISGINGGTNEGWEWFLSGTIGAARMAAFLGIPAIAVSGIDSDNPNGEEAASEAISDWVVAFASSNLVQKMAPGHYFTITLPRIHPSEIQGVRVAPRATVMPTVSVQQSGETVSGASVWSLNVRGSELPAAEGTDSALLSQGFVVVTPMFVQEVDQKLIGELEIDNTSIPPWTILGD